MTICPCCGFKSANSVRGVLSADCLSCGAHPVGEPLPRPEHELPSYARSLMLTVSGTLMVLVFLTQTIIALVQRSTRGATSSLALASMFPFDWWSWLAAAETAAWRLKWVMIPARAPCYFCEPKTLSLDAGRAGSILRTTLCAQWLPGFGSRSFIDPDLDWHHCAGTFTSSPVGDRGGD